MKIIENSTRITISGREYSSVDEMPPEDRERYEAFLKIRDRMQKDGHGAATSHSSTMSVRRNRHGEVISISVDGCDYRDVDAMPPEHRARYERFLQDFDPALSSHTTGTAVNAITIDGRPYRNVEEMPDQDRAVYERMRPALQSVTDAILPAASESAPTPVPAGGSTVSAPKGGAARGKRVKLLLVILGVWLLWWFRH
ncbi:MAG: hypothetical protein LBL59_00345 [Xanthomonadaceae bacterium]|jgi:hypothetical protein|nr:hypothetical protein [Xanthomonadaceae bacterium]